MDAQFDLVTPVCMFVVVVVACITTPGPGLLACIPFFGERRILSFSNVRSHKRFFFQREPFFKPCREASPQKGLGFKPNPGLGTHDQGWRERI